MEIASVSEAWSGPPVVITQTRSKSWTEKMTDRNTLIRMVGASSGSVMWRNRCQVPAPSMRAASCSSAGMPCRPARYSIMWKPKYFHVMTRKSVGRTVC